MNGVSLQPFDDARIGELLALWREAFEYGVGIRDEHPMADQRRYFDEQVRPQHELRLAMDGERLLGFVAANAASVSQLHVRIGHHRRGIGRMMLDWAKRQSGGALWLYTFQRNRIACAFYESQGFRVAARGFEPFWQLEDVRYEWRRRAA